MWVKVNKVSHLNPVVLSGVVEVADKLDALDFGIAQCFVPVLTSCEGGTSESVVFPTLLWLG